MHESKYFIDDEYSSSNAFYNHAFKCGGHVSISSNDYENSKHFLNAMRPYLGIVYAMNRKRLANRYCLGNVNVPINPENAITRRDNKYNAIQLKSNGVVEFRLWSRVTSVNQLKNRYALMHEIAQASKTLISKAAFNSRIRPIIMRMYNNDAAVPATPNKYIMEQSNYFKGWKCNVAIENLVITHDGSVTGSCQEQVFADADINMFAEDFILRFNKAKMDLKTIICPRTSCSCQPDTHITKWKS